MFVFCIVSVCCMVFVCIVCGVVCAHVFGAWLVSGVDDPEAAGCQEAEADRGQDDAEVNRGP